MNYELAKKLKDAGFPLHEFDGEPGDSHPCYCGGFEREDCMPILSELIEACGSKLASLNQCYEYGEPVGWDAISTGGRSGGTYKTPKDAVANLWLALNKK